MSTLLESAGEVLRSKSLEDNINTLINALSHFSDSIKRFEGYLAEKDNGSKINAEDWTTVVKLEKYITTVSLQ